MHKNVPLNYLLQVLLWKETKFIVYDFFQAQILTRKGRVKFLKSSSKKNNQK